MVENLEDVGKPNQEGRQSCQMYNSILSVNIKRLMRLRSPSNHTMQFNQTVKYIDGCFVWQVCMVTGIRIQMSYQHGRTCRMRQKSSTFFPCTREPDIIKHLSGPCSFPSISFSYECAPSRSGQLNLYNVR